jgi:hypothetical protein
MSGKAENTIMWAILVLGAVLISAASISFYNMLNEKSVKYN